MCSPWLKVLMFSFLRYFLVKQLQMQFLCHFIQNYNHNHGSSWRAICVHLTYIFTFTLYSRHKSPGDVGVNILILKIKNSRLETLNSLPYLSQVWHQSWLWDIVYYPPQNSITFELTNIFVDIYQMTVLYLHLSLYSHQRNFIWYFFLYPQILISYCYHTWHAYPIILDDSIQDWQDCRSVENFSFSPASSTNWASLNEGQKVFCNFNMVIFNSSTL